jgi:hypothetical protein
MSIYDDIRKGQEALRKNFPMVDGVQLMVQEFLLMEEKL